MFARSSVLVLAIVVALGLCALEARADTILDTSSSISGTAFYFDSRDATVGGTFVVPVGPDTTLASFTLWLNNTSGTGPRAVVLATDGSGNPTDTVLWTSPTPVTNPTSASSEETFTPNLALTAGSTYFIGFDNGGLTSASGNYGVLFSNPSIAGALWQRADGGTWTSFTTAPFDWDIATTITLTSPAVPEPGTLALVGLGSLAFVLRRRKRTRTA